MKLEEGGQEDEHGESNGHEDVRLRPLEDVYQLEVGVGVGMIDDIGGTVVSPVVGHAGQDAARAPVHPAEQQTCNEGVGHLCGVQVDDGKEQGRNDDGGGG